MIITTSIPAIVSFCCRCGAWLGVKDGLGVSGWSHGFCVPCAEDYFNMEFGEGADDEMWIMLRQNKGR